MAKVQSKADLNLMAPAPEQMVRAEPKPEIPTSSMPERTAKFGTLVHGFAGGMTRVLNR